MWEGGDLRPAAASAGGPAKAPHQKGVRRSEQSERISPPIRAKRASATGGLLSCERSVTTVGRKVAKHASIKGGMRVGQIARRACRPKGRKVDMTFLVYYFSGARCARPAAERCRPPTAPISYRPPVVRQLLVVVVVRYT